MRRTVEDVRAVLALLAPGDRCSDGCPGWAVFLAERDDSARMEIERCDECNGFRIADHGEDAALDDHDVEQLPEAQAALTASLEPATCATCNGSGVARMAPGDCEIHPEGGCATTCLDCQ